MNAFTGTGVALVTPFKNDYSVDVEALTKLVNFVIDGGVDYLVVLGTTGEPATLSETEKQIVKNTIIKANNNKLPLVLGIGGNNTAQVVHEIKNIDLEHFSAILSVSPYYNKPTQEGIYRHFEAIANATSKPIIIYNVPSRTGSNMLANTVIRLAKNFNNIIGIKEAAGDLVQAMNIIKNKPKDFLVISGDDMIALPMVLAGGSGVISVIGQGFPKQFSDMIRFGLQGDVSNSYNLHYQIMDAIDLIFEQGNPAGIKEVHKILNLSENVVRLPLVSVDSLLSEKLNVFVKSLN